MNIIYLGSGELGIHSLNALYNSDHNLQLLVTQPPHPAGRGKKRRQTPVAQWAQKHSLDLIESENVNSAETLNRIAGLKPDLIVVIAFGQKLCRKLTEMPPKGSVNVHASLLPAYRGAAPVNWAIINGEQKTGISIITLAEKMDAGKILSQAETPIKPEECAGELHDRLAEMASPLLLNTIRDISEQRAVYTPQDDSQATLAPKLKKKDGYLDFSEPAEVLERKIRGLWPWPEASANYVSFKNGKSTRVIIAEADVVPTGQPASQAGELDRNLNTVCGRDALRIKKIKPAGGKLMDFRAFANGRHSCPGDYFREIKTLR